MLKLMLMRRRGEMDYEENKEGRRRKKKEEQNKAENTANSTPSCKSRSIPKRPPSNQVMQQSHSLPPNEDDICVPTIPVASDDIVDKALEKATRTCRENNIHKASVCVVCDRIIKGVENDYQ